MKVALFSLMSLSLCSAALSDDSSGYALGIGVAADDGNGTTASLIGNLLVNDELSVFASYATTRADGDPDNVQTRDWEIGGSYDFGPVGLDVYGGQSGDPDDFDAADLAYGIFHAGEHWNLSARYLTRDIDAVLRTPSLDRVDEVTVPLEATGWRVALSYRTKSKFRFSASSKWYDYDRDLTVLGNRFLVQRLSPTSLTLATSLLDRSDSVGFEWPLTGQRAIELRASRDELAGDLGRASTFSAGFITPVGQRGDLDISVGVSRGEAGIEGDTIFLSLFYLFYGGF